MNLVEALNEIAKHRCTFAELIEQLSPDEAEALKFAIRNPAKSITQIHRILTGAGHSIGRDNLSRHREGKCPSCAG